MANQYRFYHIGEANTEIQRLEAALSAEKAKVEAVASGDSEIAKQADAITKERDAFKLEGESLRQQISALTAERDTARAEASKSKTDAETHCKDFDAKVEKAASAKAGLINSQLGVPPVTGSTSTANSGGNDEFVVHVQNKMKEGMKKGEAITFCIKNHQQSYIAWRQSGDTSKL